MLDNPFANFKREIQAGKIDVALFELFDDAEGVQIVVEGGAARADKFVECACAGMAKRRVADVVDEGKGFNKLGVQSQRGGDGAGNLCYFQRVRQPIAEMVRVTRGENLRLGFQSAKSTGIDDGVAVPRCGTAFTLRRLTQ